MGMLLTSCESLWFVAKGPNGVVMLCSREDSGQVNPELEEVSAIQIAPPRAGRIALRRIDIGELLYVRHDFGCLRGVERSCDRVVTPKLADTQGDDAFLAVLRVKR